MDFIIKKYVYELTDLESGKVQTIEKLLAFDKSFLDREMELLSIDIFYSPNEKFKVDEQRLNRKIIKDANTEIEDILSCDMVFTKNMEYHIKRTPIGTIIEK